MFIEPQKITVGIIGGSGRMGSLFTKLFRESGFTVLISDLDPEPANKELIEQSQMVIFSTPLHLSEKIILAEAQHFRPDQLVVDLSSLKEKQVRAMLTSRAEVVGLHPMFGPTVSSLNNQSVVFCPARVSNETLQSLKSFFRGLGMQVTEMTPKDHDKMMALVQLAPHLSTLLMADVLWDHDSDAKQFLKICGPAYRFELDRIGRIFAQNGEMYASIITDNPYGKKVLKSMQKHLAVYERAIARGDRDLITGRFAKLKKFLGSFVQKAFEESEKIISYIQR